MHQYSMRLMTYFRNKYSITGMTVLDVGARVLRNADGLPFETYRTLFEPHCRYTGMDIESGENVDIVGYENIQGKYDVVISGQTMEHVLHPWDWLKNLSTLFTKYICIIAPYRWREHRFPFDTYRYLPDGMRDLFDYAGIKEVEILKHRFDTVGIGSH